MKKTFSFRRTAPLIIVAILVLSIIMLSLIYISQNNRALESKPLVLIHSPLNREPFQVGEGVSVHATARGSKGLRSVELWVNDTYVDAQSAPGEGPTNSLTFSGSWLATTAGSNVVIVRAIASDGTEGQASIVIEVSEREGEVAGRHTIRQGDTLRSIAGEYDLDPGLLQLANPGLDPDELEPGDEIYIPDTEEPPADTDPPADDPPADDPPADDPPAGDPPSPEGAAPGSGSPGLGLTDDLIIGPFRDLLLQPAQDYLAGLLSIERTADQARLRLGLLSLTTSAPFEELYLYVSYGDFPQHRFPDGSDDSGVGESIRVLSTEADGTTTWDLSAAAETAAMPIFNWFRSRNLPFNLSLVGVIEGGTNSVEMYFYGEIPPENWTGIPLSGAVVSDGGEYNFEFTYNISQLVEYRGFEAYVDPTMTPPENARFDLSRPSLRWDYNPRPDEEPINGFRIYLNNSLLWVERSNIRESRLPPEWLNPPCGTNYTFAVTAYRIGIPDGPESLRSIARLEPEAESCQRKILITFSELETFNLGGDGDRPPHWGDVGPVYGHFFANEQKIEFDTRAESNRGGGSIDRPYGFNHHTRYNLAEMATDPAWNFSGRPSMLLLIPNEVIGWIGPEPTAWGPSLLVEIPEDGSFQFGFEFWDEDYGRCNRPSDPGCDDLIAEASYIINRLEDLDHHREGVLVAYNGRCQVRYAYGPAPGSPIGSGAEGWEPLPWINLERIEVDEYGRVQLHVRNTGSAAWPSRDLKVELQNRDGSSIGIYTWPNFYLEPGRSTVLEHPRMRLTPPYDACVLIDPYDDVLEELEQRGATVHMPICLPIPDLLIRDVGFIPGESGGELSVTIQNIGAALTNRSVSFEVWLERWVGQRTAARATFDNVTLEPYQTTTLIIGDISDTIRERMFSGYQVVVDPDNRIYEANIDNNTFVVPAGDRLKITLTMLAAPWDMNYIDFRLTANIVSGHIRREVANIFYSNPRWDSMNRDDGGYRSIRHNEPNISSGWFQIFGDESLVIVGHSYHRRGNLSARNTFRQRDNYWGAEGFGGGMVFVPGRHEFRLHREGSRQETGLAFQIDREGE